MFRYLTAGESHGKCLIAIIEGLPADLPLTEEYINGYLSRRQRGYGRGGRMQIEQDRVEFLSGVRFGKTIGSPLALSIRNRDWEKWEKIMSAYEKDLVCEKEVLVPRPGHADLAGGLKYNQRDLRNILERASARETAIRTAVGAVASSFLSLFGIQVISHVTQIGTHRSDVKGLSWEKIRELAESSPVSCADRGVESKMIECIKHAKTNGDSVGGVFEVVAVGIPVGLGSHISPDLRLDAQLAKALMGIPGIKGVEIGLGFSAANLPGSQVHDPIFYEPNRGYYRSSNNAGGIEGGISNGEPIIARAAMKPIPTLYAPLMSVNSVTKEPQPASVERSDACAVPAAAVVGEAVVAIELAKAFLTKFGGDSIEETRRNYVSYMKQTLGGNE